MPVAVVGPGPAVVGADQGQPVLAGIGGTTLDRLRHLADVSIHALDRLGVLLDRRVETVGVATLVDLPQIEKHQIRVEVPQMFAALSR